MSDQQKEVILCSICRSANPVFDSLNRQINQAKSVTDKAYFARELMTKVEDVLREHGDTKDDPAGKACRTVLNLRKKTAGMILNAQRLIDN